MGQRIATGSTLETAPASQISYWWLSTATNQYSYTLSSSPPDAYSVLEYTVTANGTGVLSVVNPTLAGETLNGTLALPALAAGCVEVTSGGVFTSTGLTCGSGSPGIATVSAGSNVAVNILSGNATVGIMTSPAFTGSPSVATGSQAGTLQFGSDATAALTRTGTNTFTFTATAGSGVANVVAGGGFSAGSSSYGPTSAIVNGPLLASSLAGMGLTPGECVQTTTGGVLTTTGGACGPATAIGAVIGGPNIGVSLVTSTATIGLVISPAVGGSLTTGSATAYIPTISDLSASDSTSSGGLDLGGTISHCRVDYGDTTSATLTVPCPANFTSGIGNVIVNNLLSLSGTTGSPNQGTVSVPTGSNQLLLNNPNASTIIGTVPILINSSHSSCGDSSVTQYSIVEFLNGDSPPQSPLTVGCSTSLTDRLQPAILVKGLSLFNGPVSMEQVFQAATNQFAGTCTDSSGSSCTATIGVGYTSTPICIAQDTSSSNSVESYCGVSGTTVTVSMGSTTFSGACTTVGSTTCTIIAPYGFTASHCVVSPTSSASAPEAFCAISSTTITVTAASSGSNSYTVILNGVPSASGHTFSYVLIGNPD
jgi:hypothetical protein